MRKITVLFLFIILLGGIGIVPFLPSVVHADTQIICMTPGAGVPSGHAITRQLCQNSCCSSYSPNCCNIPHPSPNAQQVEPLTDGMEICQFQVLPSGYVITAQGNYKSDCPSTAPNSTTPNTWIIHIPAHDMRVCYYQGLPLIVSCFVCTGHSRVSQCPTPGSSGNNSCVLNLSLSSMQAVTPANTSIAPGATQQFTATGICRDNNTTRDVTAAVTWSSSRTDVATISDAAGSKGLATARAAGTTTIKATLGTLFKTASLTVTTAPITSIAITPTNPSIAIGGRQQFTARDNTGQDVTTSVNWNSSRTNFATISNATGTKGLATAVAVGQTSITATSGSITSPAAVLKVTSATVTAAPVTPTHALATKPSLRDLTLTIDPKNYPERFKFDVKYQFYGARAIADNTYQIEIKVIPEGAAFTTRSFAPTTTFNYTASQGIQMLQNQEYRVFNGTLSVTAPHGRPANLGAVYGRLSFIVRVTGGPAFMPVSISKIILLEQVSFTTKSYIHECTGGTGKKGDRPIGLSGGDRWPLTQCVLSQNGTTRTATAVGQEVKLDINPLPAVGERGVRLVRLWYWTGTSYACDFHWWCEAFSNTSENQFFTILKGTGFRVRVP